MATFYIQLENKLLQISGDLTAENISKALGYVPVSHNVTDELSQRVDNITFDSLKDNPFLQDGSGELNIVDEAGNIIVKIDADGIHSVDFIAGEHRLSDKTDKTYVDEAIKNVEVDLTGYATEEYVNNIDFYNIKDNPITNGEENSLTLVDENGNIGLKVSEDGLYVKDVIADGHTLSQKADKSDIPSLDGYATESYVNTNLQNYATKDEVSDLVDMSVVTELQGKVETLVGEDADKSVRDIAVDVLTETLVSETATEAYDTLAEMSAWIKSHPEDASAMNTAIQKNATDITNLDAAYKAADTKVLTDAQEYTDNINFFTIKDNPIVDGEAGSITFVDETGYIGLKVTEDGIIAKDVVTPEHTLSSKADKSEVPTSTSQLTNDSGYITKPVVDQAIASLVDSAPETLDTIGEIASALKNNANIVDVLNQSISTKQNTIEDLDAIRAGASLGATALQEIPKEYAKKDDIPSLDGYATQAWVNNKNYATEEDLSSIEFNSLQNNPLVEDSNGEFNLVDDLGNVGFKVNEEGLFVKDVIAGEHILSNKADKTYIDNLELDELNAILVDTDSVADDPIVPDYVTENELEVALKDRQDKLVSGENIKTINGESIIGSGDIEIGGSIETYDAPFSTNDLLDVKDGIETEIEANLDELKQAIIDKKLIIFTNDGGVTVASAKYNSKKGKVFLTVINNNGVAIYIKWNDGDTELTAENIEVFDIGDIDYRLGLLEEDIPAAVTESTVSGWGFTKNTGTYSKPSTGIPKSDLASDVQTSLGKADTALQSHQDISGKQDKLVSGTNIKTINGASILGSGDITISGGGSSSGSGAYSEVNHGTSDTTFALTPNTFHVWDEVSALTLTLGSETSGVANEYLFQFTSGATATSLTLPDDIKWANDSAPTIAENMIYQVSILKGLASVLEFKNTGDLIENKLTITSNGTAKSTFTFEYPVASDITIQYYNTFGESGTSIIETGAQSVETDFAPGNENIVSVIISPNSDNTYIYTT